MNKLFVIVGLFCVVGCQKDVTVVPQQQPSQNIIVVPGHRPHMPPPPRPGIHIQTPGVDINVRPGYRYCNRCNVWVQTGHSHHCR